MEDIPNFVLIIGMDFIQTSLIHDSTCKVLHNRSHWKSDHNDIKYPLTLNTIFSVVNSNYFTTYTDRNVCCGYNDRRKSPLEADCMIVSLFWVGGWPQLHIIIRL